MSEHQALSNLHEALGYIKRKELCHGFSLRWLDANLINEGEHFEKRMSLIIQTPLLEMVNKIQQIKNKKSSLNQEETDYFEIWSFIDTLELFHKPESHQLFNLNELTTQQSIELISLIASSQKIQDQGGLKIVHSQPFIIDELEINNYLIQLAQLLDNNSPHSKAPIGLLLQSENHTMALTYISKQGWIFRDINQKFKSNLTNLKIAKKIVKGFQGNIQLSPYVAFNAKVILPARDARYQLLSEQLDIFQKKYPITAEIAQRKANFVNLAFIAAVNGHNEILQLLAEFGSDLNMDDCGIAPIYLAAQYNQVVAIEILAKYKANLNILSKMMTTPAYVAAEYGNAQALKILADYNADLNKTNDNEETPAFVAATKGHALVISVLRCYKADLNLARKDGASPAFMAAQNGYTEVVEELIKAEVNFQIPFISTALDLELFAANQDELIQQQMAIFLKNKLREKVKMYPYDIAVVMGHTQIATVIMEYNSKFLLKNKASLLSQFSAFNANQSTPEIALEKDNIISNELGVRL